MSKVAQRLLDQVENFMEQWSEHLRAWDDDDTWNKFMERLEDYSVQVRPLRLRSVALNEVYHFVMNRKERLNAMESSHDIATFIHKYHADLQRLVRELKDFEEEVRL
jgi:hypothetical protein